jgi:hypothetical protein
VITGSLLLEVIGNLLDDGYLRTILLDVARITFWTVVAFLASLAVALVAPEARAAQMIASFAVLGIHLTILALNYPSEDGDLVAHGLPALAANT